MTDAPPRKAIDLDIRTTAGATGDPKAASRRRPTKTRTPLDAGAADCRVADKRQLVRLPCEGGVLYAFWNSDQFFMGRLSDFNRKGLRLRTPYRLRPGSLIFVVAEEEDRPFPCRSVQKGCVSEIVWVLRSRAVDRFKFVSGVRFIEVGSRSPA